MRDLFHQLATEGYLDAVRMMGHPTTGNAILHDHVLCFLHASDQSTWQRIQQEHVYIGLSIVKNHPSVHQIWMGITRRL